MNVHVVQHLLSHTVTLPRFVGDELTASEMTYIVSSGALNSTHSLTHSVDRVTGWLFSACPRPVSRSWNSGYFGKAGELRSRLNAWWNQLNPAQRLAVGVIGVNVAVFTAWRVPQWSAVMTRYFTASPMARSSALPMLLANFSHFSFLHLLVNMYVLMSFTPIVAAKFGREQFLAVYLSAGVLSSFVSYAHKVRQLFDAFQLRFVPVLVSCDLNLN